MKYVHTYVDRYFILTPQLLSRIRSRVILGSGAAYKGIVITNEMPASVVNEVGQHKCTYFPMLIFTSSVSSREQKERTEPVGCSCKDLKS